MKQTSNLLEPFIHFHSLVKRVDAEYITNGKIRTLSFPMESYNVTPKLEYQILSSEVYNLIPKNLFTQELAQIANVTFNLGKTVRNSNTLFRTVFENNGKMMTYNRILSLNHYRL